MMFHKIVFAVGEDEASDAALPVVATYARQLAAVGFDGAREAATR